MNGYITNAIKRSTLLQKWFANIRNEIVVKVKQSLSRQQFLLIRK